MTTKPPILSLEDKANILKQHGVDVLACYEDNEQAFFRCPLIQFDGDVHEGERAAKIMTDHGVDVYNLYRYWHYGAGSSTPVGGLCWILEFYRSI